MNGTGLAKEVKGADAQLRDLRRTVEYVENNRDSFVHIDNVRRNLLQEIISILLDLMRGPLVLTGWIKQCRRPVN